MHFIVEFVSKEQVKSAFVQVLTVWVNKDFGSALDSSHFFSVGAPSRMKVTKKVRSTIELSMLSSLVGNRGVEFKSRGLIICRREHFNRFCTCWCGTSLFLLLPNLFNDQLGHLVHNIAFKAISGGWMFARLRNVSDSSRLESECLRIYSVCYQSVD